MGSEGFSTAWVLAVLLTLVSCGCCGYLIYQFSQDEEDDDKEGGTGDLEAGEGLPGIPEGKEEVEGTPEEGLGKPKVASDRKKKNKKKAHQEKAAEDLAPTEIAQQSSPVQEHVYEAVTLFHPSWCQDCGKFLVGFSNQGQKCLSSGKIVCLECSRSSDSHCQKNGAAAEDLEADSATPVEFSEVVPTA